MSHPPHTNAMKWIFILSPLGRWENGGRACLQIYRFVQDGRVGESSNLSTPVPETTLWIFFCSPPCRAPRPLAPKSCIYSQNAISTPTVQDPVCSLYIVGTHGVSKWANPSQKHAGQVKVNIYEADDHEQVCTVTWGLEMPAHGQPPPGLPGVATDEHSPHRSPHSRPPPSPAFLAVLILVVGLRKSDQGRAANFSLENNFPQLFVNFCHSKGYNTNVYL